MGLTMADDDDQETRYQITRAWRFGLVAAHVLLSPELSGNARLVYAVLTTYADADRTAWPSRSRLVVDAGLSRSAVARALDELDAAGVLIRKRRATSAGRDITTMITLCDTAQGYAQGGSVRTPPPGGGLHTEPLRGVPTEPHDTNRGFSQNPMGFSQNPSVGFSQNPKHITTEQNARARPRAATLGAIAESVCVDCRCLHTGAETCADAAERRRVAADAARRGAAAIRRPAPPDDGAVS